MSSTNFTYDDAIQHARKRMNDDAQRRWSDSDILNLVLPGALQQLRADRPDLFIGLYGTENFKPSQTAAIPFDDAGFSALVDALVAAILSQDDEAVGAGTAANADARSERARRS